VPRSRCAYSLATNFFLLVRETRNGVTKELKQDNSPRLDELSLVPLYVGYTERRGSETRFEGDSSANGSGVIGHHPAAGETE
jgi:hypothetical protein